MSFAVQAQQLRSAARTYDGLADSLGGAVSIARPTPAGLGHVELAAWLSEVDRLCGEAHAALASGATAISGGLTTSASAYEVSDDDAGTRLTNPFGGGPLAQQRLFPGSPAESRTPGDAR